MQKCTKQTLGHPTAVPGATGMRKRSQHKLFVCMQGMRASLRDNSPANNNKSRVRGLTPGVTSVHQAPSLLPRALPGHSGWCTAWHRGLLHDPRLLVEEQHGVGGGEDGWRIPHAQLHINMQQSQTNAESMVIFRETRPVSRLSHSRPLASNAHRYQRVGVCGSV
jgi:hypothetical protein